MTAGVFSTRDGILFSNVSSTGGTGSVIPCEERKIDKKFCLIIDLRAVSESRNQAPNTNPKIFILIENGVMAWQQIANCLSYQIQLIDVTSTRPQCGATNQLSENASNCPHIDSCPVLHIANE